MSHRPESKPLVPDFVDEILDMPSATPDVWNTITAAEAPFVRQSLLRAHTLRLLQVDPGDAYLQGVADAVGFQHLQQIVASLPHE